MSAPELSAKLAKEPTLLYLRDDSRTLLHTAVLWGQATIVEHLTLNHPDFITMADKNGNTAFHLVGETMYLQNGKDGKLASSLISIFLDAKAPLHRRNNDGKTVLLLLSSRANEEAGWLNAVEMLLKAGADPSTQDNEGCSYLHYLAQEADVWSPLRLVRMLRNYGADLNLKNDNGQTPLDICLSNPSQCNQEEWKALAEALRQ